MRETNRVPPSAAPGPGAPQWYGDGSGSAATARIEAEIVQTRTAMSGTIDAIQARLNPDRVAEQVKEHVRESAQHLAQDAREALRDATIGRIEDMVTQARERVVDARYGVMDRIRENPVPAAIAGLGLAWLLFSGDSGRRRHVAHDRYGYGSTPYDRTPGGWEGRRAGSGTLADATRGVGEAAGAVRDTADAIGENVARTAEQVQSRSGQMIGEAQERVGEFVEDTMEEAQRQTMYARHRVNDMMGESPLALGAVALGIGAAVGLAVRTTDREREWMGEPSEQLMERAGEVRDTLMEQAKEAVSDVGEQARRSTAEAMSGSSSRSHSTSSDRG